MRYSLFLFLFTIGILSHAHKYMLVYDTDKYTNVRTEASINSAIKDTLLNLQIVRINGVTNGWAELDYEEGYVHKSRLKEIPRKLYDSLDVILDRHIASSLKSNLFVVAADCPEIMFNPYDLSIANLTPHENEYLNEQPDCINMKCSELFFLSYLKDKRTPIIADWLPRTINISLCNGRLIFRERDYEYSFYRNKDGKLCRGLIPYNSYNTIEPLNDHELREVLDIAKRAIDAAKADPSGIPYYGVRKVIVNGNDFEYLDKLRRAYFMGNKDALKYYPYLVNNYHLDGEGTHAIEKYDIELFIYNNSGEVVLE